MDMTMVVAGIGVAIGIGIFSARQGKAAKVAEPQILAALQESGTLTLPELVVKLGMKDGFVSRGKVVTLLNPMVERGVLVQTEPPGTTMKDRLSVLRYSLAVPS